MFSLIESFHLRQKKTEKVSSLKYRITWTSTVHNKYVREFIFSSVAWTDKST